MRPAFSLLTAGVAACASVLLGGVPAVADSQATVRSVGFPEGRLVQLSMVGCTSLYDRSSEPLAPFIGRGPEQAPLGDRSLGYDLEGGNAVGSLYYRESMLDTTTAEISVFAYDNAVGVAYAGYQEPADKDTQYVWIGRAPLFAPADSWTRVRATDLRYTWTKYNTLTYDVVPTPGPPPVATVPQVTAARGDGAGFYTIGFGCDGARFSTDAWRVGSAGDVTSFDLEGLTTTTDMVGTGQKIDAGQGVTLTGRLRLGIGDRLQRGTLMLEARPASGGQFEVVTVLDAAANDPSFVVHPTESTVYRWRFADRPLAEGSVSSVFAVTVRDPDDPPDPTESPNPTEPPSPDPTEPPSTPPPSDPPSPEPTETPEPTESPEPTETPEPSTPPETETPTPDPSATP